MAVLIGSLAGCNDDGDGWNFDQPEPGLGLNDVVIDPEVGTFSIPLTQVQTATGPVEGLFSFYGSNPRYYGADLLLVDFSVSQYSYNGLLFYQPVTITITSISPDTVAVYDPPESGLTWQFQFDQHAEFWGPGWISEPLTVGFYTTRGNPVHLSVEIGVAPGPPAGMVSGQVWHDQNTNGMHDVDEGGLSGIPLEITSEDGLYNAAVYTDVDGRYRFENLPIKDFMVALAPADHVNPISPATRAVAIGVGAEGYDHLEQVDFGISLLPVASLTVNANADATVQSENIDFETYNFGFDPYLRVGTTMRDDGPNDAVRSLVRFDLPYEMGAVVEARLEMSVVNFPRGADQTYQLDVHAVVESGDRTPWIEGNGSFSHPNNRTILRPEVANGVAWAGDVDNFAQPDFDVVSAAGTTVAQADYGFADVVSWNVTGLVNDWLDGSVSNHGVLVRDTNPDRTHRMVQFSSRDALLRYEGQTGAQGPGPRLVLIYQ
ncbi:MAG: DNRLRE domain-containing protein [Candidatus Krumholzibacteria bacterium]|nr:DNRLRE domain-containing protein [Candidatus Krumholzibacteria bacterium]